MPKEIRNPKSEKHRVVNGTGCGDSAFWNWGNDQDQPLVFHDGSMPSGLYDLMERTAKFGESVIQFAKNIPQNPVNNRLIDQLVGASTSIGANYCEADDAVSGKDFKNKIGICRKESKEAMFFLRMIGSSEETLREEARKLWREAKELNLIFGAIWRNKP